MPFNFFSATVLRQVLTSIKHKTDIEICRQVDGQLITYQINLVQILASLWIISPINPQLHLCHNATKLPIRRRLISMLICLRNNSPIQVITSVYLRTMLSHLDIEFVLVSGDDMVRTMMSGSSVLE